MDSGRNDVQGSGVVFWDGDWTEEESIGVGMERDGVNEGVGAGVVEALAIPWGESPAVYKPLSYG